MSVNWLTAIFHFFPVKRSFVEFRLNPYDALVVAGNKNGLTVYDVALHW